jgi:hypothetical protein
MVRRFAVAGVSAATAGTVVVAAAYLADGWLLRGVGAGISLAKLGLPLMYFLVFGLPVALLAVFGIGIPIYMRLLHTRSQVALPVVITCAATLGSITFGAAWSTFAWNTGEIGRSLVLGAVGGVVGGVVFWLVLRTQGERSGRPLE